MNWCFFLSLREENDVWLLEGKPLEAHTDWVRDVAWCPSVGLPLSRIASCSQVRPLSLSLMLSSPSLPSLSPLLFLPSLPPLPPFSPSSSFLPSSRPPPPPLPSLPPPSFPLPLLFSSMTSSLLTLFSSSLQDCKVIIWTKDESTGGTWSEKVSTGCLLVT